MENKLQAKGLGLNGEVLFDEELGTIGEETPIKDKNGVHPNNCRYNHPSS